MRILMLGTGPFAVPTFRWLLDSPHDVPALVTRPPRPVHRRGKPPAQPMRDVADEHGLPVLMPEDVNADEAIAELTALSPELLMVCDYGQILSRDALRIAPRGGINLHGSLLPKYRGAAPINWAIYHGEAETGVSVIHMTPRLDGGPILTKVTTPIEPSETAPQVEEQLSQLGVDAVREAIDLLAAHPADAQLGEKQNKGLVTKAPRLTKHDGAVDWTRTARQIYDQLRAFQPWPGCYTWWQRAGHQPVRLILNEVAVIDESINASPGEVALVEKHRLLVATGGGLLELLQVQPAGKRPMTVDQWLRGHQVAVGDQFGEPAEREA